MAHCSFKRIDLHGTYIFRKKQFEHEKTLVYFELNDIVEVDQALNSKMLFEDPFFNVKMIID